MADSGSTPASTASAPHRSFFPPSLLPCPSLSSVVLSSTRLCACSRELAGSVCAWSRYRRCCRTAPLTGVRGVCWGQVRVVVAHKSMQTVVVKASYILKADGCSTAIPCVTSYQVTFPTSSLSAFHARADLPERRHHQVLANGTIVVTNDCTLSPHLPPVARVGIQLSVPGKLRRLRWFGRGPHESYPDRSPTLFPNLLSASVCRDGWC